MQKRRLGTQGLEVSAIGLGTMGITGVAGMPDMYGVPDEAEGIATIRRALDLGVTFFDTAEVYGPWRNEEILGRALDGRRHEAVIATKFGFRITSEGRMDGLDSRPENVRRALDGCLRRLGTEYVDLWYQHRLDRSVPIEDTVGAMAEQVRAGKVRYLGLSEVGAATLRRAHAVHPISALQSEYSLWERNLESPAPGAGESVIGACRALGVGIVPYSPLGRGFLTGAIGDVGALPESDYRRRYDPRFAGGNFERNRAIVEAVRAVAARHAASPAQIALAWLLHQGQDVVPIPGTKRRKYLEDNVGAVGLQLTSEDLRQLGELGATAGARYNERALATVDR
jgi:aryl-alcohol dehydrogenase-like predicted oxidoreductase